jgi:hypothetical protein
LIKLHRNNKVFYNVRGDEEVFINVCGDEEVFKYVWGTTKKFSINVIFRLQVTTVLEPTLSLLRGNGREYGVPNDRIRMGRDIEVIGK